MNLTYVVIGLVLLALYINRSVLLGMSSLAPARYAQPPPQVTTRLVTTSPPPQTTAQLIGLVHEQTEAEALMIAHQRAADSITQAKANQKATGLPWTFVVAPTPTPSTSPTEPSKG